MDFSYSEEQEAVRELADRIFDDLATHERLRAMEQQPGDRFDADLWSELAAAGLVGIAVPERLGGGGLGFVAAALVCEAAGRTAAYVPAVETVATGAPAIAEFGTAAQHDAWLPGIVAGETVVTAALAEVGGVPMGWPDGDEAGATAAGAAASGSGASGVGASRLAGVPSVTASPTGDGWTVSGHVSFARWGMQADVLLVPAQVVGGGIGVFIVPSGASGVERVAQLANTGQIEAAVTLADVGLGADGLLGPVDEVGTVAMSLVRRATAGICMLQAGAVRSAVRLMAEYTKTREQFGKAIATFQAVGQRAADAYVDAEAVRLTAWQAAWRIDAGLPADEAVAVAKYWAAEGGQRVVHAAVHLHGGVGVDRDYPLHRHFLATKYNELTLGGATEQLRRLGAALAEAPD
jgi:alkylation response protein AidB-like acyl-CoA dehydrogenase